MTLLIRTTNARGLPTGESNRLCLHPDAVVATARSLHADGASYQQIADVLGVPRTTVWRWCTGKTRKPATSVRVVRVKPPLQSNRERQGRQVDSQASHTVAFTDAEIAALRAIHGPIA